MSNKTRLQTNNTNLQSLIDKANTLPDAGSGGSGGNELICFIITLSSDGNGGTYCQNVNSFIAEKDMTWQEWIESSYNTIGVFDADGYPAILGEMMGMQITQYVMENDKYGDTVYLSDLIINAGKYKIS